MYTRINWEDYPNTKTPINAENLNKMDSAIYNMYKYIGYDDVYGVEVDFRDSTFTRIASAVGKTEGKDFDKIDAFGGRRRCNLSDDGKVLAYYGEPSYKEDGSNGQVMVEQPRFYYKVVPIKVDKIKGGKGYHTRVVQYLISDTPKVGFKLHPAFIQNGEEKDYIYLSAYEGSAYDVSAKKYNTTDTQDVDFSSDKLSSIANAKPMSGASQSATRDGFRKIAKNRGIGWSQSTIQAVSCTQLLFLIEYANFNMQYKIGKGITTKPSGSGNESELTGATSELGNTTGTVSNNAISYRGEENFYGNRWKWIDGINIYNHNVGSVHISDHDFVDDTKSEPYKDAGITICGKNGYVSAFGYNENFDWLFVTSETDGNNSLPVGDYFSQNKATPAYTVAKLGGDWYFGSFAGGFCWHMYDSSGNRYSAFGGRLLYIPQEK